MTKWIHDRAEHLLSKNPTMDKSLAFAIATQQAHATGHTPKGYGTAEGKHEAKTKFDTPKGDEQRANPRGLDSPKMASKKDEDLEKATHDAVAKSSLLGLTGGASLAGAGIAGVYAPERVLGYVPMYHGTSTHVADKALKEGLLASMGGSGGAALENVQTYIDKSKGKVHVYPHLVTALEYAGKQQNIGNEPAILRAAIPYEQFKKNFEVDDTMPILSGRPTAYRTANDVGARHLSDLRNPLRGIASSIPSKSEWLSYVKNHPGRLGAGLGLLVAAPALAYAGYKGSKKALEVKRETEGIRKEYAKSDLAKQRMHAGNAGVLGVLAPYLGLGSAGLARYAYNNIDSKELGLPVLRKAGPKMFAEHLNRNPGKLLNYAALAGIPALAYGAYAAGKAALKHHRASKELSKELSKEGGVGVGAGMTASQYSGPLSFGPFKMVSGIPAFRSPATAQHNPLLAPEEWAVGGEKSAAAALGAMSPAGRLTATQRVGAPKITGVSGPSIADVSKPKGFGMPLPGAKKNAL